MSGRLHAHELAGTTVGVAWNIDNKIRSNMTDEQVGQSHIGADASNTVEVRLRPDLYSRLLEKSRVANLHIEEVVLRELEAHDAESAPKVLRIERDRLEEYEQQLKHLWFKLGFSAGIVLTGAMYGILRLIRRK